MRTAQAALGFEDDLNTFTENTGDAEWTGVVLKVIRSIEETQYQHKSQGKVTTLQHCGLSYKSKLVWH